MSNFPGTTRDLSDGGAEGVLRSAIGTWLLSDILSAVQALLKSMLPSDEGNKITPEAAEKLAAKFKDLVGEDAATDFLRNSGQKQEVCLCI
jgi:hypothetical protein